MIISFLLLTATSEAILIKCVEFFDISPDLNFSSAPATVNYLNIIYSILSDLDLLIR